ncbi:MAG: metal ABC transporter permease [Candidatus Methylacidiphilales bacterium]|nr:metal ABC transporter permease [Candidatus Methylacidiphilales bacterium]
MHDFLQYEFLRNTLLAAMLLGPTCALLGVFVTLRGMAFFSDALAHSALTGVALGYLVQEIFHFQVPLLLVVLLFSFGLATVMAYFFEKTRLRADTIIAFSFTGSVALGVVVISALGKYRLIDGLLFGSIHANSRTDLVLQAVFCTGLVAFLLANVKPYALTILQPELARAQGVNMQRLNYFFAMAIAATVAMGMKMVGALLLSALIVVPPAAAKLVSGNFRGMLVIAPAFGLIAAVAGVTGSNSLGLPTGPTIVLTNVAVLLVCLVLSSLKKSPKVADTPLPN